MTQRPITWTSEELYAGWDRADIPTGGVCPYVTGELRRFLDALGAVHPAEAREMQREAYRMGWLGEPTCKIGEMVMRENCDARYPSLLPQSPPPLVPPKIDELEHGVAYFEERAYNARKEYERAPEVGKNVGNCGSDGAAWVATCRERYIIALNELARAKGAGRSPDEQR